MFKRLTLLLAVGGLLSLLVMPSGHVFAQAQPQTNDVDVFHQVCTNAQGSANQATGNSSVCDGVSGSDPISGTNGALGKATRLIGYIAGIAAFIIMIIGGIMYLLSGGDASKVTAAKDTILYAAIGLVVVIFAQAIIIFVINKT